MRTGDLLPPLISGINPAASHPHTATVGAGKTEPQLNAAFRKHTWPKQEKSDVALAPVQGWAHGSS